MNTVAWEGNVKPAVTTLVCYWPRSAGQLASLTLDRAAHDAFDQIALAEEEYDDHRNE